MKYILVEEPSEDRARAEIQRKVLEFINSGEAMKIETSEPFYFMGVLIKESINGATQ